MSVRTLSRSITVVREKVLRIHWPVVRVGRRSGGPPSGAGTSVKSAVSSTAWISAVRLSCRVRTRTAANPSRAIHTRPA